MTIEEAKQVRIVDFLAQLGHHAQYVKSDQYWYLSPLRDEQSPSFKVNDRLNEWYDFGAATGGDLVELGKYLYQTESVSEVLAYIGLAFQRYAFAESPFPGSSAPSRGIGYEKSDCRPVTASRVILLPSVPENRC